MSEPFRIAFTPYVGLSDSVIDGNLRLAREYPKARRRVHQHPVAVVGGSPSLAKRLDELKTWPGEIWAINFVCDWLAERGIESTLFTVDPYPFQSKAKRALLATCCDPSAFEGRESVQVFDMREHAEDGISGGVSTASRAPALALLLGYPGAVFFGCDSSYEDRDHVDRHENNPEELMVRANGADYRTRPDLLLQAESLSMLMRTFPDFFVNRSEGLLAAMVADEKWAVVGVSAAMKKTLIDHNGDSGLYNEPYKGIPCQP